MLNPEIKVTCTTCGRELTAKWGNFGGELEIEPCEECVGESKNHYEQGYSEGKADGYEAGFQRGKAEGSKEVKRDTSKGLVDIAK